MRDVAPRQAGSSRECCCGKRRHACAFRWQPCETCLLLGCVEIIMIETPVSFIPPKPSRISARKSCEGNRPCRCVGMSHDQKPSIARPSVPQGKSRSIHMSKRACGVEGEQGRVRGHGPPDVMCSMDPEACRATCIGYAGPRTHQSWCLLKDRARLVEAWRKRARRSDAAARCELLSSRAGPRA